MEKLPLLLLSLSMIFLLSTVPTSKATPTLTVLVKDQQVPCTMCSECENPCHPLPPPPPPPILIECPPPPPPPSPPPPAVVECPPPPPAVVECPPPSPAVVECPPPPKQPCDPCETLPPPKPPCEDITCFPPLVPVMPVIPTPEQPYFPPVIPTPEQPYFPPVRPRPPRPRPPRPRRPYLPPDDEVDGDYNDAMKMMPVFRFSNLYFTLRSFTFVAILYLPCYLFIA